MTFKIGCSCYHNESWWQFTVLSGAASSPGSSPAFDEEQPTAARDVRRLFQVVLLSGVRDGLQQDCTFRACRAWIRFARCSPRITRRFNFRSQSEQSSPQGRHIVCSETAARSRGKRSYHSRHRSLTPGGIQPQQQSAHFSTPTRRVQGRSSKPATSSHARMLILSTDSCT